MSYLGPENTSWEGFKCILNFFIGDLDIPYLLFLG